MTRALACAGALAYSLDARWHEPPGTFPARSVSLSLRLTDTQRGIMKVVEVDGEPISPEDDENDAGWITSPQQRSSRAKARLTDRDSRNQEGARREQAHKIQHQLGVCRPRLPALPREDIEIVIRPRDGLNTSRVSYAQLRDGVLRAAAVSTERASEDIFRLQPGQNILFVSTPTMENAKKYCSIKDVQVGSQTYATTAYVTPPDDTSKGVIHDIPNYDTQEDITKSLVNSKNPAILQARRMGKPSSVIIVFEGTKFPHYVYYRGSEYRCFLHKKVEVCNTCGRLGHRHGRLPQTKRNILSRAAGLKTHRQITVSIQHAPFAAKRTSQATKMSQPFQDTVLAQATAMEHQQRSRQEDGGGEPAPGFLRGRKIT
ncbi:hypothetical protein HPB48_012022 [Haemaphysalis longicornis]|uniref:Uncharacterized protein n=1 Tax=Haemaphysalis longicornis TaxID=44386 RepID=A0A9J6GBC8_HAELO|nr:hypothetical protein HPB48_012022 [Haemaphysalis longicornis]